MVLNMKWDDVFVMRDDGLLYWSDEYLEKPKMHNISRNRHAGHVYLDRTRKTSYIVIRYLNKLYGAHRIIWEMAHGEISDNLQIDHIDGNGLNNALENLRLVPISENLKNKSKYANNSSGHAGVSWHERSRKWRSYINDNGKRLHLGYFATLEEAIKARKEAENLYGFHCNHGR